MISDPTATVPMVNLTINDRPVSVPKGTNLIAAARHELEKD